MPLLSSNLKRQSHRYTPIVQQDFVANVLEPIYDASGYAKLDTLHSHHIAVFFIMMANGIVYDSHPSAVVISGQYHALARAALSLDSLLQEVTCATVQALYMIVRFMYVQDRASNEERWILSGLCSRLCQTVCHIASFLFIAMMDANFSPW